MNRLLMRALVALLTLTIGLVSAEFWVSYHRPLPQPVKIKIEEDQEPKPTTDVLTFEDTGEMDMFMDDYRSSDGVIVRFGCYERASAERALKDLPRTVGSQNVLRTPIFNAEGARIGERAVWVSTTDSYTEAEIEWTEGARLFVIKAPSLRYASEFEKSTVWAGQGCFNEKKVRGGFQRMAPPNNGMHPTADTPPLKFH
ncbi:MAG: hypothetical protein JOZ96_24300 [Acidobacteria bacterium]|nr:hypothetical protein [Acidobacteriota bacterium]